MPGGEGGVGEVGGGGEHYFPYLSSNPPAESLNGICIFHITHSTEGLPVPCAIRAERRWCHGGGDWRELPLTARDTMGKKFHRKEGRKEVGMFPFKGARQ